MAEAISPKKRGAGRPFLLGEAEKQVLVRLARETPHATMDDLRVRLEQQIGKRLKATTVGKYLRGAGWRQVRRRGTVPKDLAGVAQSPYGYNEAHRPTGLDGYPSSVTDAEWELVAGVFAAGGPGRPEQHTRRTMLDAICYVVRSGCSWRMLPKDFPPWQSVYSTFRRWAEEGRFERMHDRLRAMWRQREGRAVEPTGAVIDSQSVRTSE